MPELPEVATMVKALRNRIEGRLVRHALVEPRGFLDGADDDALARAIVGLRVKGLHRRGKYVRLDLEPRTTPPGDPIWRRPPGPGRSVTLERPASLRELLERDAAEKPGRSRVTPPQRGARLLEGWQRERGQAPPAAPASLILHLKMTGRYFLMNDNGHPLPPRTRLLVALSGHEDDLLFGVKDARKLARGRLLTGEAVHAWPEELSLGPDALETRWTGERLARHVVSRRPIKLALLDQARLAGLGNIYAAEVLHRVRIHPERPADRLAPAEWNRLAREIPALLRHSMKRWCALSRWVGPAVEGYGDFRNELRVYGREGESCRRCGGTIRRMVMGGRGTCFCPGCQV